MSYQTPIGPHDGDSWEQLCQVCLKIKHGGNYIEVPASPGDYGIDGFTLAGEIFQCYCPEKEYTDKVLYEKQRQKITDDIPKLEDNKIKISKILNGVKIKRWYLLTPKFDSNDILSHCSTKTDLVKSYNLPFIDTDFRVVPLDYQYLLGELGVALKGLEYTTNPGEIFKKIVLEGQPIGDEDVEKYKVSTGKTTQTQAAFRKLMTRFPQDGKDYSSRVYKQVDSTVKDYLVSGTVLKEWETLFQDQLENFLKIMDGLETKVKMLTDTPSNDNNARYQEIITLIQTTIDSEFSGLSKVTRDKLAMGVAADWLLRCPLNLE